MLPGDAHSARSAAKSASLARDFMRFARRFARQIGFFVATTATAAWRRGPRGCWASVVRLCGLPAQWLPLASSRRRLSASMDFLEQFRQGPETQSEWNLLLWRVTFPMIALVIFTLLAVLGKFGHRIYSFLVCPVWYFSQFVLVAHPFLLVFKFHESDASIRKRIWQVLAALSVAISAMEWFLSSPPDASPSARSTARLGPSSAFSASVRARFLRHSWIVANTVFGVVALVAIPRYFYRQKRAIARDSYDTLTASPSATTLFIPRSPATTPRSAQTQSQQAEDPFQENDITLSPRAVAVSTSTSNASVAGAAVASPPTSSRGRPYASVLVASSSTSLAAIKRRSRAVFLLTAGSAVLVWIAMFSSYSSLKAVEIISKYWFTVYLFSPIVCGLLIYVLRGQSFSPLSVSANASASFDFVAIYSVLIVHLPVFLGHLCFRLFTIVELADPAHPAHAEARGIDFAAAGSGSGVNFSASTSWIKLGISIVYLLVMQTYFYAMTQVVNSMAEPFAHPSLLYLGQLYYYLFWYVLVGSDTPIDALYWGMLLVNNVHIAFLNTGIYADVKQSSTSCFSTPLISSNLNMFRGSSMALCFRATTLTMANVTRVASASPVYKSTTNVEQLRPLYFLMKLAEQDNMADTTALILVPSLLTLLAVLDKPSHGFAIVADQLNLWVRCIFMFGGRMGGAYLAREIFAYKLRSRLRQEPGRRNRAADDAVLSSIEGVSTRLWIQRLMLQDFHRHFWYLTVVTIVVTFACFERMEVPARFALLT